MKKSFKTFLIVALIATIKFAGAQTTNSPAPVAKEHSATGQGRDASQDFETRMAKFQESYHKMQSQAPKAKDPHMKSDMEAMLAKMTIINNEYNGLNAAGVSEEQKKQTQQKIQGEMKEVRKMHDDMKAKYGDQMGGKKKGAPGQPAKDDESPKPGEDLK